jgi:hypothetical protein
VLGLAFVGVLGGAVGLSLFWRGGVARAAAAVVAAERPGQPKGYVCNRALTPVTIDGKLDEDAWKAAEWTDTFVDIEGDIKPRPRYKTRAKMLWDDTYFYVGAQLEEPHVWGTLLKHDSVIFQDNDFEIFIDPDGDNHEYYEIEINALNTEWDLFLGKAYRDGGPVKNEWEIPGLKTAVHVQGTINDSSDTDTGWSVEFAIPWKVLAEFSHRPAPPKDGDQWRVNFSRVEWLHEVIGGKYKKKPNRSEANWVWSPQGVIDMHQPDHWAYVQFSTDVAGKAVYKADPAGPIRDRLMAIYRAQRRFRDKNKRWANTMGELGLAETESQATTITPVGDKYEATITFTPADGEPQTWKILADSKITRVK